MRRSLGWQRLVRAVVALAVLLIPCSGVAAGSLPGRAAPVIGGDVRMTGPAATSYEEKPDVAWNSNSGQYLVVWSDGRDNASRGDDIYARLVDAEGKPVGGEKVISGTKATGSDRCPAVAWGATTQQYLVIWQDNRNWNWDIYGRRVGPDGNPIGEDFKISASNADEFCGDVAWGNSNNQFLVVWEDYRSYGRGADVFGRLVGADGKPVGTADTMICGSGATADDYSPAVAWGETNKQFLVVWRDYRDYAARGADIYGRRLTAAGAPVADDFRISGPDAIKNEYSPAIAWSGALNQFMVVWEDWRQIAGRGVDIYGQRVKANGALAGGEKRISGPNATSDENTPAIAWSITAFQYLVAWQDWRDYYEGRAADVRGQKVSSIGIRMGADFRLAGPKGVMNEYDVAIAWDAGLHRFLAVWTDARSYNTTPTRLFDIYGRLAAG